MLAECFRRDSLYRNDPDTKPSYDSAVVSPVSAGISLASYLCCSAAVGVSVQPRPSSLPYLSVALLGSY